MRTPKKAIGVALALVATLALAGCVPPSPHVIPTAEPSVAPVFKSDAAALAAAKKAYLAYLVVSDEVAQDGGDNPERFEAVVTASWLSNEKASAAALKSSERRQIGGTAVMNVRLQQASQRAGIASVSVYACLDLSNVKYVDTKTGQHPTQAPTNLIPVEVDFVSAAASARTLLVERNTPWQGTDFCQ